LIISLATAMAEASPAVNGESPDQHVFVDDDGNMWGEDELGRYRRPMETQNAQNPSRSTRFFHSDMQRLFVDEFPFPRNFGRGFGLLMLMLLSFLVYPPNSAAMKCHD
jgi:hypothetical protein